MDWDAELMEIIEKMLISHDLTPSRYRGWVTVDGQVPAFRVHYESPTEQQPIGHLLVEVLLGEDCLAAVYFAAYGDEDAKAIKGAMSSFMISMFHPILASFGFNVSEDEVSCESWKTPLGQVNAWGGSIALRTHGDTIVSVPRDWLSNLEDALSQMDFPSPINWLSVYCARHNNNEPTVTATLNGEIWDEGVAVSLKSDWPIVEGFYGCRVFYIIGHADQN